MTGKSFSSGELIIRDGRFVFIGERTRSGFDGETIDLSDCLVLPGFVNAHCHLTLSGLKGRLSKNLSFVDWVLSLIEIESDLKEEERVAAFQTGANEMLLSGVTTLGDYLGNFEWLPHYEKIPFRQVVFLEAIGFRKEKSRETARKIKAVLKSGSPAQDRITLGVAPHAPYSVSPELFQLLYKLAKDHSVPISCHVAELEEEKEFLQTGGGALRHLLGKREAWEPKWKPPGKSTLSYLADLEVLDSLIAIHLNHIGTDWKLLRANQMSAVFCPRSSRWFRRRKYMDVKEFLDCGIPVGLGTDSLASNHSLNFLEELL